jgi:hypothetical protein
MAGDYFTLPFYLAMAGIMGASMGLLILLFSKREQAALILSPILFVLLGLLYIGRILHPDSSTTCPFPPEIGVTCRRVFTPRIRA